METKQEIVLWLTGMPCSGKSTLADELENYYNRQKRQVQKLDGDFLRNTISKDLGFKREDRFKQVERVAYIAKMLSSHGIIVIVALVSPYQEMRTRAKEICEQLKEVYVKCSSSECRKRDVKGMYKKALNGELKNFTGVDDPYEIPSTPDVVVDTENNSIAECIKKITAFVDTEIAHSV